MIALALRFSALVLLSIGASGLAGAATQRAGGDPIVLLGSDSYAPLTYVEDGELKGIQIDIARALSDVLGREIRIEAGDWQTVESRVLAGEADGVLTMSQTDARRRFFAFSEPTMNHEWGLFVRRGEGTIWDVAGLAGRRVGVTRSGLPLQFLQTGSTANLVIIDDLDDGFARLKAGAIDAVAADLWVGAHTLEQRGIRGIVRAGSPFAVSASGIAVASGNWTLLDDLNRGIRTLKADGTLDRIHQRWRPREMVFLSRGRLTGLWALVSGVLLTLLVVVTVAWRGQIRARARAQRAEARIRLSEEKYRTLVENAHDIIFTVDPEGNCLSMNEAGRRTSGYVAEDPRGVPLTRLVAPEDVPAAIGRLRQVLAGEAVPQFELTMIAKDGHRRTMELDVAPVSVDGHVVGVQGIARDITSRKELESQLLHSQKMEAVGRLAGGVAHDFNNILTVIAGSAEMALMDAEDDSAVRPDLEEIRRASASAAALTRQLLIFSRKSVALPVVLDINESIKRLNKMLRRLVPEHVEVVVRLGEGAGHVRADAHQLEQVIVNLAVNARDAMPSGGLLTIETAGAADDPWVTLRVTDTGVGMSPKVLARIWEPFFTTKDAGKGTGLGLPTVQAIVDQAGGRIDVESAPGCGTAFTIQLPRVREVREMRDAVPQRAEPATPGTILLVEDDHGIRALAERALRSRGYDVLAAPNGDAALALAASREGRIDLLVTDVVMPGMNGKQLAEALRAERPEIKILYASGYTDDFDPIREIQAEAAAFLQKPYTPAILAREVQRLLAPRQEALAS